jgi:hypothetical protein
MTPTDQNAARAEWIAWMERNGRAEELGLPLLEAVGHVQRHPTPEKRAADSAIVSLLFERSNLNDGTWAAGLGLRMREVVRGRG